LSTQWPVAHSTSVLQVVPGDCFGTQAPTELQNWPAAQGADTGSHPFEHLIPSALHWFELHVVTMP
jgi:hypothetical protein